MPPRGGFVFLVREVAMTSATHCVLQEWLLSDMCYVAVNGVDAYRQWHCWLLSDFELHNSNSGFSECLASNMHCKVGKLLFWRDLLGPAIRSSCADLLLVGAALPRLERVVQYSIL